MTLSPYLYQPQVITSSHHLQSSTIGKAITYSHKTYSLVDTQIDLQFSRDLRSSLTGYRYSLYLAVRETISLTRVIVGVCQLDSYYP